MLVMWIGLGLLAAAADPPCPAGETFVPGSLKEIPRGDQIEEQWLCSKALKQLSDMGTGRTDTGTGFDGGVGPTSAVANAALAAAIPDLTPEKLERYSKSEVFKEAAAELSRAAQQAQAAQDRIAALKKQQEAAADSVERQKMQIEIANAEQERIAARGAQQIAAERVKRSTIRLDAMIIMGK